MKLQEVLKNNEVIVPTHIQVDLTGKCNNNCVSFPNHNCNFLYNSSNNSLYLFLNNK